VNKKNAYLYIVAGIFIVTGAVAGLAYSFALPEEIKEVVIDSDHYGDPGSYRVKKSASWIDSDTAKIRFDFDSIRKLENDNYDVMLVLDISSSMNGNKEKKLKQDVTEFVNFVLKNSENMVSLVTFGDDSSIISEFTNDKTLLLNSIENLTIYGNTNYYDGLVNVDTVMKNYQKKDGKDCVVLFLTDGYPNKGVPNEEGQYQYLKSSYPYLKIHAVQYEVGKKILEPITKISDQQFVADMKNLDNVLFDAGVNSISYETVEIVDYIDPDYFYIESENDIIPSVGNVQLENEGERQKVIWTMNRLSTGKKVNLDIKVKLKQDYVETKEEIYASTNTKEIIRTSFEGTEQIKESSLTPVLKNYHDVVYDLNLPDTCVIEDIPVVQYKYGVSVAIANDLENCGNYEFGGWKIVTSGVKKYNDDSFIMSDKDVVLRAIWGKSSISKTMDGTIYENAAIIRATTATDATDLWKYRSNITKVVIQNKLAPIENAVESWDLSVENNESVMGYLVNNPTISGKYIAYIQADEKIYANPNSSGLFANFSSLTEIEGLQFLDTSKVENMSGMFSGIKVTSLDLGHFDTSKVTDMDSMFSKAKALTTLDLSSFDTSNVTDMGSMFYYVKALPSLDLSTFDTSKVTDMGSMFSGASSLTDLDLSHFDTSQVVSMGDMFSRTTKLVNLNISNFNTSKVTGMSGMFSGTGLTSLDLSHFDTSQVKTMKFMFENARSLTSLNLSSFDTSKVTNMIGMFCSTVSLSNLDFRNATFDNVTSYGRMFERSFANISIRTKDDTTKVWLQERLSDEGITSGRVNIG